MGGVIAFSDIFETSLDVVYLINTKFIMYICCKLCPNFFIFVLSHLSYYLLQQLPLLLLKRNVLQTF